MGLFDNVLKDEESLFSDEISLEYDYVPFKILYRESEQKEIANCIRFLLQGRPGKNLIITGRPGIGKTMAVKYVFDELKKETDDVVTLHINCWKKDTFFKILNDIAEQIGYKWGFNKRADELFKELIKILNKKKVAICFDEVDKLSEMQTIYSFLEDLSYKSIFLITNDNCFVDKLDSRIKSRLMAEVLDFKAYNYDETRGIMEQRKEMAFFPNVWASDAFDLVADKTAELEDVRIGLFLLRESGNAAEMKASRKINLEHSEKAISKLNAYRVKNNLEDDERFIIDFVKNNPGNDTLEVYEEYKKKFDKSLRTFQRKVKDLKGTGNLSVREEVSERGGMIQKLFPKLG